MDKPRVLALFKFGKKCHVESFVTGQLYMNTLRHFVELEGDEARTDKNEGTGYWRQNSIARRSIQVEGTFREIKGIAGPLRFRDPKELEVNVLCLYALRIWSNGAVIEARTSAFGESVAVVLQGDEFLRRVRAAAEAKGWAIRWNLVEYCDPASYHGEMGIFRKPLEFGYQSEFRIAIQPGAGTPLKLDVGPLDDICVVIPAIELNTRLTVGEDGSLRLNTLSASLAVREVQL